MKAILSKILCLTLALMMMLTILPAVHVHAAGEEVPVVVLEAQDAINPILDIYVFAEDYNEGGPFTVEFEWKCDL